MELPCVAVRGNRLEKISYDSINWKVVVGRCLLCSLQRCQSPDAAATEYIKKYAIVLNRIYERFLHIDLVACILHEK